MRRGRDAARIPSDQEPTVVPRSDHALGDGSGGRRAHEDLGRGRGRLHRYGLARARSRDDELTMRAADEEELEATAMDADRHPEPHDPGRGVDAADPKEFAPHTR